MRFERYDTRHYPTLAVREGYEEWARTYDSVVQDEMDLRLLARLTAVGWEGVNRAIDFACGTGRIGVWLQAQGVRHIDGLDLTPAMLAQARERRVYEQLFQVDLRATGLPAGAYDLAIQVLADEHLTELFGLYQEVARVTAVGGCFVLVGYHPHFLLKGIPTHFDRADGKPVAIESHVHLMSDHVRAAHRHGWTLVEMEEGLVDQAWLAKKPKWAAYEGHPVSFAMVWRRT